MIFDDVKKGLKKCDFSWFRGFDEFDDFYDVIKFDNDV